MTDDEIQLIDKFRSNHLEQYTLGLPSDGTNNIEQAAALMLQGFSLLMFENVSEQWMRDKFLSLADELSRYKLNQVGADFK